MRSRMRPAFTLIEVLFAVLILAIGLLGIGSIFPAVIRQQREASDRINATVVTSAIQSDLLAEGGLLRALQIQDIGNGLMGQNVAAGPLFDTGDQEAGNYDFGLGQGREYGPASDEDNPPPSGFQDGAFSYLWEVDWIWDRNAPTGGELRQRYVEQGEIPLVRARADEYQRALPVNLREEIRTGIPVEARLYPKPFSTGVPLAGGAGLELQPLYVWDIVLRRSESGGIQAALFLRRIDPGIRAGGGRSIAELLTNANGESDRGVAAAPFPVAFDYGSGTATRNGIGDYSVPFGLTAELLDNFDAGDPELRGRFVLLSIQGDAGVETDLIGGFDPARTFGFIERNGQLFVDNLGNVRRVIAVPSEEVLERAGLNLGPGANVIQVDPPYSPSRLRDGDGAPADATPAERASKLRQIVFTPQVPAAIEVFNLR